MKNTHVLDWIGAYLDGELPEGRKALVEAHLAECPDCQAEVEAQRRLSALLKAYPVPEGVRSTRQAAFVVQANLSDRPAQAGWKRGLHLAWQATPLMLLVGWAFSQAVLLLSNAVLLLQPLLPQLGSLGLGVSPDPFPLVTTLTSLGGWLFENTTRLPFLSGEVIEFFLIGFLITLLSLALFAAWLASWWVSQQNWSHNEVPE